MALTPETEPRSGLVVGFDFDDSGWDTDIENTLRAIARLKMGGGVLSRSNVDPSLLTPNDGDAQIPAATALGVWAGYEDYILIWDDTNTVWVAYQVPDGFGIYILDEDVYSVYKTGSGWSDGVAHAWT